MTDCPYFVSVARAAQQVARPPKTIYRWFEEGKVGGRKVGGTLMVDLTAVIVRDAELRRAMSPGARRLRDSRKKAA